MDEKQKTIALAVGEDIIARNILTTDFWPTFKKATEKHGWKIVCVTNPKIEEQMRKIVGANTEVVLYERGTVGRKEKLVMSLSRSAIDTHTNLWSKMRAYKRGDAGFFDTYLKRILTKLLGHSSLYKRLLRRLILRLPPDPKAITLFKEINADVCIPLSLTHYDFDVPLAQAARALNIPLLGMVRSWDNLSSHGLLRVLPDVLFLQNEFLKDMGTQYQDFRKDIPRTEIVGLPHYDAYKDPTSLIISREKLVELLGLDPKKKIIVYGAMGEFLFLKEGDMPVVLNDVIESAGLGNEAQVVFRSHPRFIPKESLTPLPHVVIQEPRSYTASEGGYDSEQILISLIHHAHLVVTGASTFALDALVLNKPVVCVSFDGRSKVSYWESAERFFDLYTHFEEFMKVSETSQAKTETELVALIKKHLNDGHADPVLRKRMIERLVAPFDGHAGERLAERMIVEISVLT